MNVFYKSKYASPLGKIILVSDNESLVGLYFEDRKTYFNFNKIRLEENSNLPILFDIKNWLDDYFGGKHPDVSKLPLKFINGTDFQKEVWKILLTIPYSRVLTYKDVTAKLILKLGLKSMSNQAVANAIAKNPILIIVPCHRVIASNGTLRGYVAGLDIKEKLLKLEDYNNSSSINLS